MKTFETVQKNFANIGFMRDKGRFHMEQWLRTFEGFLAIIMQCLYLPFDAVTIKEYMDSIFITSAGVLIYLAFLNAVLNTKMIFLSIDKIENLVNKSEFKPSLFNALI